MSGFKGVQFKVCQKFKVSHVQVSALCTPEKDIIIEDITWLQRYKISLSVEKYFTSEHNNKLKKYFFNIRELCIFKRPCNFLFII